MVAFTVWVLSISSFAVTISLAFIIHYFLSIILLIPILNHEEHNWYLSVQIKRVTAPNYFYLKQNGLGNSKVCLARGATYLQFPPVESSMAINFFPIRYTINLHF